MIARWAGLAVLGVGLIAGCGTQKAQVAAPSVPAMSVPLSTSLVTAQGTWAITVMGGSAAQENNFWQVFVRPASASRWSLVTPPGVADNGGLVAAGTPASLLVGFRPSQDLAFSPLAASDDTGRQWSPGLLDADLASAPDAIAAAPSGQALALLADGRVEQAPSASAAAAGHWSQLVTLHALAATTVGRECGLVAVYAVSFGQNKFPMAAGSCERRGVAGVFTDSDGTWRSAGLTLPARFGGDQVLGLAGTAPDAGSVLASGFGTGGSAWLLLSGGRAETIDGAGGSWRALPAVPAGTSTLAPGPGGSYDALAVSGSRLTVWRLTRGAWVQVQVIKVPVEYGSSS